MNCQRNPSKTQIRQVSPIALHNLAFEAVGTFLLTSLRWEQSNLKLGLRASRSGSASWVGPLGDRVILDESYHLPEPFPHLGNKAAMTFTKKTS